MKIWYGASVIIHTCLVTNANWRENNPTKFHALFTGLLVKSACQFPWPKKVQALLLITNFKYIYEIFTRLHNNKKYRKIYYQVTIKYAYLNFQGLIDRLPDFLVVSHFPGFLTSLFQCLFLQTIPVFSFNFWLMITIRKL